VIKIYQVVEIYKVHTYSVVVAATAAAVVFVVTVVTFVAVVVASAPIKYGSVENFKGIIKNQGHAISFFEANIFSNVSTFKEGAKLF